jgi:hypothetical protein
MFNFNENKVTLNHFYTNYRYITGTFYTVLFRPHHLSFSCVFPFILPFMRPPGPGSASGMRTVPQKSV